MFAPPAYPVPGYWAVKMAIRHNRSSIWFLPGPRDAPEVAMRLLKTLTLLPAGDSVGPRPACQGPAERRSAGPALRPCGFSIGMCGLSAIPASAPGISRAALPPGTCRRSSEFTSPWRRPDGIGTGPAAATACGPKGRRYELDSGSQHHYWRTSSAFAQLAR